MKISKVIADELGVFDEIFKMPKRLQFPSRLEEFEAINFGVDTSNGMTEEQLQLLSSLLKSDKTTVSKLDVINLILGIYGFDLNGLKKQIYTVGLLDKLELVGVKHKFLVNKFKARYCVDKNSMFWEVDEEGNTGSSGYGYDLKEYIKDINGNYFKKGYNLNQDDNDYLCAFDAEKTVNGVNIKIEFSPDFGTLSMTGDLEITIAVSKGLNIAKILKKKEINELGLSESLYLKIPEIGNYQYRDDPGWSRGLEKKSGIFYDDLNSHFKNDKRLKVYKLGEVLKEASLTINSDFDENTKFDLEAEKESAEMKYSTQDISPKGWIKFKEFILKRSNAVFE